ncbi:MAG: RnfABCDGE type electron transport complex subunit B [Clostridiales bacterium]|nr:RnfABCDGE type electron transport complex subunit B [Clostridiales bacterium]
MNVNEIIIAVVVLCVIAIIIGVVLSLAEKAFHIDINELEKQIRDVLPGSNCGGCGYAGCGSLAKAIADGDAPANSCPVGREPVAKAIAEIMGSELEESERSVAYVRCDGGCKNTKRSSDYYGVKSCAYVNEFANSDVTSCKYGCISFGDCVSECDYSAVKIIDGKAVVDESLCVVCGKCVKACPRDLIEFVPASAKYRVECLSHANGKQTRDVCTVGCIACRICEKNCPTGAITVLDNLAEIDYSKCTKCGICSEKCPRNIIKICAD